VRLHWIVEFQKRGCPHIHWALWYAEGTHIFWWKGGREVVCIDDWLDIVGQAAAASGAIPAYVPSYLGTRYPDERWLVCRDAQYVATMDNIDGWFEYLAKHAVRGVRHYQRAKATNLPEGWASSTGRLWGHVGDWPRTEPVEFELPDSAGYRVRRWLRGYCIAKARGANRPKPRVIAWARRMLKDADRRHSAMFRVACFVTPAVAYRMVELATQA